VAGSARGSPAIWQPQQPQLPPPGGSYGRQVGPPPPAPQRSSSGYPPGLPGGSNDGSGAAAVARSGSGADILAGVRTPAAGCDPRFDLAAAPSSSADNSVHGGGAYLQPEHAGSAPGVLRGPGPADVMSAAGSMGGGVGGGSSHHLHHSSAESFGTWPHRGGSEASQMTGLPPSVRVFLPAMLSDHTLRRRRSRLLRCCHDHSHALQLCICVVAVLTGCLAMLDFEDALRCHCGRTSSESPHRVKQDWSSKSGALTASGALSNNGSSGMLLGSGRMPSSGGTLDRFSPAAHGRLSPINDSGPVLDSSIHSSAGLGSSRQISDDLANRYGRRLVEPCAALHAVQARLPHS